MFHHTQPADLIYRVGPGGSAGPRAHQGPGIPETSFNRCPPRASDCRQPAPAGSGAAPSTNARRATPRPSRRRRPPAGTGGPGCGAGRQAKSSPGPHGPEPGATGAPKQTTGRRRRAIRHASPARAKARRAGRTPGATKDPQKPPWLRGEMGGWMDDVVIKLIPRLPERTHDVELRESCLVALWIKSVPCLWA